MNKHTGVGYIDDGNLKIAFAGFNGIHHVTRWQYLTGGRPGCAGKVHQLSRIGTGDAIDFEVTADLGLTVFHFNLGIQ